MGRNTQAIAPARRPSRAAPGPGTRRDGRSQAAISMRMQTASGAAVSSMANKMTSAHTGSICTRSTGSQCRLRKQIFGDPSLWPDRALTTLRNQPCPAAREKYPPIWVADLSVPMFPVTVQIRGICAPRLHGRRAGAGRPLEVFTRQPGRVIGLRRIPAGRSLLSP